MLRVCWAIGGEELATFSVRDVRHVHQPVKYLKTLVRERCSIPVSIQKLLHDGHPLNDSQLQWRDEPMELMLVLASCHGQQDQDRKLLEKLNGELSEYAVRHGNAEVVRRLLDAGADKDCPAFSSLHFAASETVLVLAAGLGHLGVVEVLLERGALIDGRRRDGRTALSCSGLNRHVEVSRLLLQAGARPDLFDSYGMTALHDAALEGHVETVFAGRKWCRTGLADLEQSRDTSD